MEIWAVTGGKRLSGEVTIHGAKNSALPILAATLLCREACVLHNCPQIEDVETALSILRGLGAHVQRQGQTVHIHARTLCDACVPRTLAEKMRSSILFLGALTAREGEAEIALPGGCRLGARPIDLHLSALRKMGAEITVEEDTVRCRAARLNATHIRLPFPSVGATENILLAATACAGTLTLENAALEPEIGDLIGFLRAAGAEISGAGTKTLTIRGGRPLHGTEHTILPDRIETATYLCAAAACGGDVRLQKTAPELLRPVLTALTAAGCAITGKRDALRIASDGCLHACGQLVTAPYPAFPTDAQAPMMAALLRAEGESVFEETVFSERFRHVPWLRRLGAEIRVEERCARVRGVKALYGAALEAEDLRGGAALLIAALSAEGNSYISGVKHIKRGYARLEENLNSLGAHIRVLDGKTLENP